MMPEERARWLKIAGRHDRECGYLQACCEMATTEATDAIRRLIAAIAEEREACAGIVDSWGRAAASFDKDIIDKTAMALTAKIAAAIRARL